MRASERWGRARLERWAGILLTLAAVLACDDIPGLSLEREEKKASDDDDSGEDDDESEDSGDDAEQASNDDSTELEVDGTDATPATPSYGAIAWSPRHERWGASFRRASIANAKQVALSQCGRSDCSVKGTFGPGKCLSVAHGNGGVAGWGWADTKTASKNRALDECKKRSSACSLQKTVCNDGPPTSEKARPTPTPSPSPKPGKLTGRSEVPSMAEWNVASEVPVKGKTSTACETKMVREWLRISCRSISRFGGKPKSVRVTLGGDRADVHTFSKPGVASLVMPFVEGIHIEAIFTWSKGSSRRFESRWPRGAPEPQSKGKLY